MRRAGADDRCAGQLRILDGETSSRSAGAIDQHWGAFERGLPRKWQLERLVERLADTGESVSEFVMGSLNNRFKIGKNLRGDADAERGCFLEAQVLWNFDLDIALGSDNFTKRTALRVHGVAAVDESSDAVAFLEGLGDLASYLFDNTRIVYAAVRGYI
jgi:hypothetical protein